MRTPLVAGNWKSYKTVAEARALISEMLPGLEAVEGVDNLIFPPYFAVPAAAELLAGTKVSLGAQNMNWEAQGAFTGEVSPPMVKEFCQYILIGHSERRTYYGETDETVNRRTKAALEYGLIPCVCVGETLEEREAGKTDEVVSRQMMDGLQGIEIKSGDGLVIAYEPVWAIGTGRASTPENAVQVIGGVIRPVMAGLFGEGIAQSVRVLYGGSVKPENAAEYFQEADVDGALVGGASLKADSFVQITEAAR
ncbi:MAG: triose-phosphate isomerase [Anaerolineales bacterium]|nr:triose-phosphate isomerase [Anaerolineales bacterium]